MKKSKEAIIERKRRRKNTKNSQTLIKDYKKVFIIIAIIICVIFIISTGFALVNMTNENMMAGVTIDGIKVQGLNKEEAQSLIETKILEKINNYIKIYVDNEENTILLSQIELNYDIKTAIDEAYNVGRGGNIFANNFSILKSKIFGEEIEINFEYNEKLLNNIIQDIKNKIENPIKEPTYCIEDEELIITKGVEGYTIDENELKDKIIKAMQLENDNCININTFLVKPDDINIEEIYEEVHTQAQDAYYTTDPVEVFPEVIGIDFDIESATEILKEEKDEYVIPLVITYPTKTTKDIGLEVFPDRLSTISTRYDATNQTRTNNLQIAMDKINGVIVMPGEIFSYNKTLGKRTVEAGYKDAAGYAGGKVVQMIGGGICQISSTLYDAVLYANLDIVERHNHAFLTSYIGPGKDATVVYGSLDFQFKNTRNYPIKIVSNMQNGIATISIYGIKEENEYDVEIFTTVLSYIPYEIIYENDSSLESGTEVVTQEGQKGCKSITYKILKQNGKEISRSVLSTDTYSPMNKYISRGTK